MLVCVLLGEWGSHGVTEFAAIFPRIFRGSKIIEIDRYYCFRVLYYIDFSNQIHPMRKFYSVCKNIYLIRVDGSRMVQGSSQDIVFAQNLIFKRNFFNRVHSLENILVVKNSKEWLHDQFYSEEKGEFDLKKSEHECKTCCTFQLYCTCLHLLLPDPTFACFLLSFSFAKDRTRIVISTR